MKVLKYLGNRLREPSTWASLASIATLFNIPATHIDAVTQLAGAAIAAAGVFLPEQKGAN